jgi:hypothetical protein
MGLVFANKAATVDVTDLASYNVSVAAPADDSWLIVDVMNQIASGTANTPSLSGGSLSYVQEAQVSDNTVRKLTRLVAQVVGTSPGAYTLVADFAAQTQVRCYVHVTNVLGGDASDICVDANSLTAFGSGTTASVTLNNFVSANNRPLMVAFKGQASETFVPKEGYTELADPAPAEAGRVQTSYYASGADPLPSSTWTTTTSWAAIASEIKASAITEGDSYSAKRSFVA